MNQQAYTYKAQRVSLVIAGGFLVLGGIMLAVGGSDYAGIHTIFDTTIFLFSGLLGWQAWEIGSRVDRILPKWLALGFAMACVLELIHTLITVDFNGVLAPISQVGGTLRPITWAPAAYTAPLALGIGLFLARRKDRRMKWGVLFLCFFVAASSVIYRHVPAYTAPVWLGITRPTLIFVPLLWMAVGFVCWRLRATDRKLPTLVVVAAVLCVAHTVMLYSRAPHDTMAIVAHLGKVSGYLILLLALMQMASSDMRQLIQAEEALRQLAIRADEANASKSRFLAVMSHELRTPMTGVLGMSDLLLASTLTSEQEKFTRTLARSARTLLGLLNDILDFSKIEAGHLQIENMPFLLSDILHDIRDLFAGMAAEKGLALQFEVPPNFQDAVVGDETRIRQVLVNLVGNAIKFTDKGRVTVRLEQEIEADGRVVATFVVSDTGIGVAPDKIERMFQPFAQADVSITRKFGGTGLGLAISRNLVRAMGGDIEVSNRLPKGSVFTFFVKLDADVNAPHGPRIDTLMGHPIPPVPIEKEPALKVLLAEDNETTRMLVTAMLGRMGHSVDSVADGAKAVEATKAERYDIVLMDMQMPVMDGPEAMAAIRRREAESPHQSRLPIIALTADVRAQGKDEYVKAGADSVAGKPIDWRTLVLEMTRLARGHRADGVSPPPPPNLPPRAVSHSVVEEMRAEIGDEALTSLLRQFIADLPRLYSRLEAAVNARDLAECKRAAHSLKGISLSFGALHIGEIAKTLELDAASVSEVSAMLPALRAGLDEVENIIAAEYGVTACA